MSRTARDLKGEARRYERETTKAERDGAEATANGHAAMAKRLRNAAKAADQSDWDPRWLQPIRDLWDAFLGWLFKDWGFDDTKHWAPNRPNSPRQITARVKARISEREEAATAAAEREAADDKATAEATRQHDAPVASVNLDKLPDLDAIGAQQPPAPPSAAAGPREAPSHTLEDVISPKWCNCTGMAHEAHCAAATYTNDFASGLDDVPSPSSF